MKNVINRLPILLTCIVIAGSCSKSHTDANTSTNSNPSATIVSGTWTIGSFMQRTESKTSSFDGYIFTFVNGGTIKVEKDGVATSGTWLYSPSAVGYYGSTPSKSSFTMNLGTAKPLSLLTRTWNIDSINTNSSRLSLVNPEVAENMHVNFSRQ